MQLSFRALAIAVLPYLASSASIGGLYKREPTLDVTLSSVENAVVKITVRNVGHEELSLFTAGTILDKTPIRTLKIHTSNFTEIPFISHSKTANYTSMSNESFISLAAGASIENIIDAAQLYDFAATVEGTSDKVINSNFTIVPKMNGPIVAARSLNRISRFHGLARYSKLNGTANKARALTEDSHNMTTIAARDLNVTSRSVAIAGTATLSPRFTNETSHVYHGVFNFLAEGTIAYTKANSTKLSRRNIHFKSNTLTLSLDLNAAAHAN